MIRIWVVALALGLISGGALAGVSSQSSLEKVLRTELQRQYPNAQIEVIGQPRIIRGEVGVPTQPEVLYLGENARGEATFQVRGQGTELSVSFRAVEEIPLAVRRIHPTEKLKASDFVSQKTDLAAGPLHSFRTLILPVRTDFSKLEAHQTILEGQPALSNGVHPIPDVERGAHIAVHLISGELTLSTQGIAQEPGTVGQNIRILAGPGKRELVGKLNAANIAEVRL